MVWLYIEGKNKPWPMNLRFGFCQLKSLELLDRKNLASTCFQQTLGSLRSPSMLSKPPGNLPAWRAASAA